MNLNEWKHQPETKKHRSNLETELHTILLEFADEGASRRPMHEIYTLMGYARALKLQIDALDNIELIED